MAYLQAVIGLIQIVNWIMGKLDDDKKAKALEALWLQEFMARDKELIDRANAIREAASRELDGDPERLLADDQFRGPRV